MKMFSKIGVHFIAVALVLISVSSVFCSAAEKDSNEFDKKGDAYVLELTDKNFDSTIAAHPVIFVMFYAPWCQHSKKMRKPFSDAAANDSPKITYGRVDATTEKETAKRYNIKAFPTFILFRNGKASEPYDGGRSATDLNRYTDAMFGSAVRVFRDKVMWDASKTNDWGSFALCVEQADSPACHSFTEAADTHRGIRGLQFLALQHTGLAKEFGLEQYIGKVVVCKAKDDGGACVPIAETVDVPKMRQEIQMQALPTFSELAPWSYKIYMAVKLPMLYLFLSNTDMTNDADKAAFTAVRSVAPQFKGKLTFVYVDASKYSGMTARVGLSGDKFPSMAIDHSGSFFTFPSDTEITTSRAQHWVLDFLAGKLTRAIRSDPVPATPTVDGLTTVTGLTFDRIVTNAKTEHVFLVMHAPFCMHCKEMMPALAEVAKKMKDEDITIAKMDATTNDYDKKKFPVYGFPTMYYINRKAGAASSAAGGGASGDQQDGAAIAAPAGPEEYTGGRSAQELLQFLREKVDA